MARRWFDDLPSVKRRRSNFDLSHRVATTMQVGKLTPIDVVEVLPGDTWTVTPASFTRLSRPLIRPIMDDVYLDSYSFFVPLRLCMSDFEQVFGDSSTTAYSSPDLKVIPSIIYGNTQAGVLAASGTVADYLGIPSSIAYDQSGMVSFCSDISILPFRAFALIWNEFFRDQNVDQETYVNLGNTPSNSERVNSDAWSPTNYFGKLPLVRRYGDLFSTALPGPQKGPSMKIPGIAGAPVYTTSNVQLTGYHNTLSFTRTNGGSQALSGPLGISNGRAAINESESGFDYSSLVYPNNLAVLRANNDGTINALRTAFQLQKYLERDAIYGTRYREYLYAAYGVTSPDSRIQIPEFLAGAHNRMNIQQVPSTVSSGTVPQGTYAANIASLSEHSGGFSKSFTEHGYIVTVACVRYKHLYSQSISSLWRRLKREDFYDPLFANLGMQAVYVEDVYGVALDTLQKPVFGYQEAFANYRTILDRVSGQMRPDSGNLGQFWSLADKFAGPPSLIDLVHEDGTSFERVLSSSQSVEDPFVVDFNFKCSVARVVSPYSMPGYVDHH
uniref:Major capsid protein n=1 Tax=Dulem virus 80 TaxID=3145791 RepID=A0AAU8AUH2_9VIRU